MSDKDKRISDLDSRVLPEITGDEQLVVADGNNYAVDIDTIRRFVSKNLIPKSDISGDVTNDSDKVPSCRAVDDALGNYVLCARVENSVSNNTAKIPSSKAVHDAIATLTETLSSMGVNLALTGLVAGTISLADINDPAKVIGRTLLKVDAGSANSGGILLVRNDTLSIDQFLFTSYPVDENGLLVTASLIPGNYHLYHRTYARGIEVSMPDGEVINNKWSRWSDMSGQDIASRFASIQSALNLKVDKSIIETQLTDNPNKIPTSQAVDDAVSNRLMASAVEPYNIGGSTAKVPSSRAVKDALDEIKDSLQQANINIATTGLVAGSISLDEIDDPQKCLLRTVLRVDYGGTTSAGVMIVRYDPRSIDQYFYTPFSINNDGLLMISSGFSYGNFRVLHRTYARGQQITMPDGEVIENGWSRWHEVLGQGILEQLATITAGLDEKADRSMIQTVLSDEPDKIPSSQAVNDALDGKIDVSDLEHVISGTENKIPCSKAIKEALDEQSQAISDLDGSVTALSRTTANALSHKVDSDDFDTLTASVVVLQHGQATHGERIAAVEDQVSRKIDRSRIESTLTNDPDKIPTSLAVDDAVSNRLMASAVEPYNIGGSTAKVPSSRAVKNALDALNESKASKQALNELRAQTSFAIELDSDTGIMSLLYDSDNTTLVDARVNPLTGGIEIFQNLTA